MPAADEGPGEERSHFITLGGAWKLFGPPQPNVKIFDKGVLTAVARVQDPRNSPNPNAVPLHIIHGWDPKAILMNTDLLRKVIELWSPGTMLDPPHDLAPKRP